MIIKSILRYVSPQWSHNDKGEKVHMDFVVEEHTRDDIPPPHNVYQHSCWAPEGEDHEAVMLARVPELEEMFIREAEQVAERVAEEAVAEKIEAYVRSLDPKRDIGLTEEEVVVWEKARAQKDTAAAAAVEVVNG